MREQMSPIGKAALLAISLAFVIPAGARAETSVFLDFGGIAFGFEDGYWDRDHRWHEWQRHEDWERFRYEQREHAYAWRHDRDRDMGWREEYWHHDNGKHKGWYKHHDDDDHDDRGHGHKDRD